MTDEKQTHDATAWMQLAARDKGKTFLRRTAALVIDLFAVLFFWGVSEALLGREYYQAVSPVVAMVMLLYVPVCESQWGRTLGKRFLDLEVVDRDGQRPKSWQLFARYLFLLFVDAGFLFWLPFVMRFGQRGGDLITGTYVVRRSWAALIVPGHVSGRTQASV